MKTYEYWIYEPTRELWAVRLLHADIDALCGPLDARDVIPAILPYLPYDARDVSWARNNRGAFRAAVLESSAPADRPSCAIDRSAARNGR
jgi:hypothetical protein